MKRIILLVVLVVSSMLLSCAARGPATLHTAAARGDTPQVRAYLQSGSPLEGRDAAGWTPIMHAAGSGNIETVRALIAQGANVNATDPQGNTTIYYALEYAWSVDTAKLLKDNGARLTIADKSGGTPLHYLAKNCPESNPAGPNIIAYLVESDVNPSAVDNAGATAFFLAMENNCMEMVGVLRKRGVMETFKGIGAFQEALRKPSFYAPTAGEYVVSAYRAPLYELAIADCNHMLTGNKTGLLFALGPFGWAASTAMDQVRISKNLDKCMKVMGFECTTK